MAVCATVTFDLYFSLMFKKGRLWFGSNRKMAGGSDGYGKATSSSQKE
jgi:hypothetical protein